MERLSFLQQHLDDGFLPLRAHYEAMQRFTCSFRAIEEIALSNGITPLRYKRNQTTISVREQYTLFNATVAIIGCGGLGGFISEFLGRIGVGNLILIDGDVFEEHNLNRQNFSTLHSLGLPKVSVLTQGLEAINPALHVKPFHLFFDPLLHTPFLHTADVVVDALDNPDLKCLLASWCKEHHKAFVHGAIAGYCAQFSTCDTLEHLYTNPGKGAETLLGNPSFTASFAASIQSVEIIKLLLGKPHLETPLFADLWAYEFNVL